MHPLINTAIKAARAAGDVILRYSSQIDRLEINFKSRNDLVSEVDRMAEDIIIETVRERYPTHAILAEESGAHEAGAHAKEKVTWIIDPLDGTTNFLHGLPHYGVSIAIQVDERLEHGVIFDPNRNELFHASRGRGAQLDGRRIRVSKTARLNDAVLATGFPFRQPNELAPWIDSFRALALRTRGVRRAGSAALDLAWLACGRYDGFWEYGLSPWDIAAGMLLVREAGGQVSDPLGKQGQMESGDIVAGNPAVYDKLIGLVAVRE